eukprot:Nitzschia sp. Nitz4//scaffold34_size148208//2665//4628//NITZ4_002954-RA/size148208-augustus-gene-0.66-mRNA-1//-1//CDS//3329548717//8414//frame0
MLALNRQPTSIGSKSTWAFLIVLLLVLVDSSNAFWNTRSDRPSRRLTDEPSNLDVDAATGTVKATLSAEEEASKTCDGQLAQSLVQANDEKYQAQKERDLALEEQKKANSQAAMLENSVQALKEDVSSLNKANADQLEECKQLLQQAEVDKGVAVQLITRDKDAEFEAFNAQVSREREELQQKQQEALQVATEAYQALEQAKDAEILHLTQVLEESKDDTQREMEAKLTELEKSKEEALKDMQAAMDAQAKQAEEILEATRDEAKRVLVAQVNELKATMAKWKAEMEEVLADKVEQIQQRQADLDKLKGIRISLESQLEEANKEIAHWHDNFAQRSYCNMTFIGMDIYDRTMAAYQQASEVAAITANVTAEHIERHTQTLTQQAQEGYEKSQKLYQQARTTVEEEYWPAVKPHYEQHVAPVVAQFLAWKAKEVDPMVAEYTAQALAYKAKEVDPVVADLQSKAITWKKTELDPRIKEGQQVVSQKYAEAIHQYGETCKATHGAAGKLAKENKLESQWSQVSPFVSESCEHPEESVQMILKVIALFLVILLAGPILSFTWWLIRLAWSIFLTVTLLRFVLPPKKATKTVPPPPPTKPQSNGKSANGNGNSVQVKKRNKPRRS